MDPNVLKVIELICAALPARSDEGYDEVSAVTLYESDFKRQGMSLDLGVAILKHELSHDYAVFQVTAIQEASTETVSQYEANVHFDHFGEASISFLSHPSICKYLVNPTEKESTFVFSFENCVLKIKGKDISFGSTDDKEYGCYVLEHIFSHDLKESSFYRDIHTEILREPDERYSGKRYYDACGVIQKRIAKETGTTDFLVFNSGERGFVRINPAYIR